MFQAMVKQMVDFQKATFENSFIAMAKMHEQGEAVLNVVLDQASWLPQENKKFIKEWAGGCQTARDGLEEMINESFKSVEAYSQAFADMASTTVKAN